MRTLREVLKEWTERAEDYERADAPGAAYGIRQVVEDVQRHQLLRSDGSVTIAEAVPLTNGYTEQALRQMVHRGELENISNDKGPIRVRISDLPRKPGPAQRG